MRAPLLLTLFLSASLCAQVVRGPVHARRGMVVSAEAHATRAGVEILRRGGNAVDAAVATAFALSVTLPRAGGLGGGGFLVVSLPGPKGGEYALDFRERAPRRATATMYVDPRTGKVRERASKDGFLAVGVPGSAAGLCHAAQRWGKLDLAVLIQPALRLAREGFVVDQTLADSLLSARERLIQHPESRRIFLRGGAGWRPGDVWKQPQLAKVLEAIAAKGAAAFYTGQIAEAIERSMAARGGLIDCEDLREYAVRERDVLRGSYRGHELLCMPPPSSGGVTLLQVLGICEAWPMERLGVRSAEGTHRLVEAMRSAFRDRARWLGDPDFSEVPTTDLLRPAYLDHLRARIGRTARRSRQVPTWNLQTLEREETTHLSAIDGKGGAASLTTSLNGSYGSAVTVPGTGLLLNNHMDDFAVAPGVPNEYGLVQGAANAVGPRKRPLSSMAPLIMRKDGEVVMVVGSPGGPTIISTVLQCVMNRVDHGMDAAQLVAAPRVHHQWLPDRVFFERYGLGTDLQRALEARGHELKERRFMGNAQAITRDPKTGRLEGARDPRGHGLALGWDGVKEPR